MNRADGIESKLQGRVTQYLQTPRSYCLQTLVGAAATIGFGALYYAHDESAYFAGSLLGLYSTARNGHRWYGSRSTKNV